MPDTCMANETRDLAPAERARVNQHEMIEVMSNRDNVSIKKYLDKEEWRCTLRDVLAALAAAGRLGAPRPTRFGRLVRWPIAELESWEATGCGTCRMASRRSDRVAAGADRDARDARNADIQ